jgi:hypothetical protein
MDIVRRLSVEEKINEVHKRESLIESKSSITDFPSVLVFMSLSIFDRMG